MKSVSTWATAAALALGFAAGPPVLAQGGQPPPAGGQGDYRGGPPPSQGGYPGAPGGGQNMRNMTLQEFQSRQVANVMRMDTNREGRVSLAEWTAWHEAHPGRGGQGDPARAFERYDLNHDGYITPDEVAAVAARRYARLESRGGPGMRPGSPDQGGMGLGGANPPPQLLGPQ